jgi:hypothetical protein
MQLKPQMDADKRRFKQEATEETEIRQTEDLFFLRFLR